MQDRLRSRDLAILAAETASTPMHNATVEILEPGDDGFDYDRVVRLIEDRIAFVPRYRQRLGWVPGMLANPAWVDDPEFDLAYHVRRSALPRPGTLDQLRELVARIISRPLDRERPLWEVYFVEGLEGGRVAMLSKSHEILVDGVSTVDLGQVLLDSTDRAKELGGDDWRPGRRPTPTGLLLDAVTESVRRPQTVLATSRSAADGVLRTVGGTLDRVGAVANAVTNRRGEFVSPINGELSQQRRFVAVATPLDAYRKIRRVHGGSVNDVILATLTGALRSWLMTRAESLGGLKRIHAIVPISTYGEDDLEATQLGTQVKGHFVDLPVGESSPLVRLHQVSYSFESHKDSGRTVAANRLAGIAGFAPTTFHALGSRVAFDALRRGYHLSVTNVPGPQFPLYAAGARMVETYPVHPLFKGHALAVGVTSYDGQVFYGITADRDSVPDADLLGTCIAEALDELLETTAGKGGRAPRGTRR